MDTIQNPIVIFEPFSGGHRGIFVQHLYQELLKRGDTPKTFIFYVNPLIAPQLVPASSSIKVIEAASPDSVSPLTQLKELCKEFTPQEIMLMALGDWEWSLLFWRCPFPLSSILFVQYPEIKNPLKRKLKSLKTRQILSRNSLKTLFLLNGARSAKILQEIHGSGTRFLEVVDPVVPYPQGKSVAPAVKGSQTAFLYFGAISRRKGFGLLVDAMLKISAEEHHRMKFIICGRPEDPGYFEHELGRLKRSELPVNLEVINYFVSEVEMWNRFSGSDVVLMPYLRPEYSSGVLGIAAQTLRPVIGPKEGLLGRLIQENHLGMVCKMNTRALKKALVSASETLPGIDVASAKAFAEKSSPKAFACEILTALCGEE